MSAQENRFFRILVSELSRKNEDEFTQLCFELGAEGVAEDLEFSQADLQYDPDVIETDSFHVNVYFSTHPGEPVLMRLEAEMRIRFPEARYEFFSEENKDWLAEWKKGFKPFRFSGPFWIIPSWLNPPEDAPKESKYLIYVEPGMAFGTGSHETTRLAAGHIIDEIQRRPPHSMIDVGTGTGILALVGHRMGVETLVGIDNDPEARRTARENLERNGAQAIAIPDRNIEDIQDTYDLVVANIIDGVLMNLREHLVRILKPGGRMILSGVLMERESEFYADFTKETGLKLLKKTSEGEWSAALLEKS